MPQVEFTGFVSDVRDKLGDVNLVCVPSDREPLGRVIFESQLFGIPVLASDSGGNSELIEDGSTGYLYALGNVNELATKLLKVKDNNHQLVDAQQFVLKDFPQRGHISKSLIFIMQ